MVFVFNCHAKILAELLTFAKAYSGVEIIDTFKS
jgi:hypothetical protein